MVESSILEEGNNQNTTDETNPDDENVEIEGDDEAEFHADDSNKQRSTISPRWPTRVFAAQCVRRIISACVNDKTAHFDLALAKEMQSNRGKGQTNIIIKQPN